MLATLVRVDLAVAHTVTTIVERGSEASAWPPLLIAVVGGSVGFLLGAMARALGIPKDVRLHDAAVADRDEALATWVADRDHELRRVCKGLRATVAVSPDEELPERLDKTPPYEAVSPLRQRAIDYQAEAHDRAVRADRAIADAKAAALHEYRDEARRARLDVATIIAQEGWAHDVWRRMRRPPRPALEAPQRAIPVLDAWRLPTSMNAERHTFPDDATRRTLDDAIATMPVTGP